MGLQLHLAGLVLLAALAHATWNALLKASGDRFLTFTVVAGTGTVIGGLLALLVDVPNSAAWPYLAVSMVIHNGYYVFLILAYRAGDLSRVYPLARGAAPLLVAVLAGLTAGEVLGTGAWAGIGLVSVGIISLCFTGGGLAGQDLKPVLFALGTALFIAAYTVVDGLGIRLAGAPMGYIAWLNLLEGIPFMTAVVIFRRRELVPFIRAHWVSGVLGGVLGMVAFGLVLYALSLGAMAYVAALRETSVLFAVLIGTIALREPFGRARIVAAAVIVAGIVTMHLAG
jgi:drug/metabolite transporter (DMT)-like permease